MKIAFFNLEDWQKNLVEQYDDFRREDVVFYDYALDKNSIPEEKGFEVISVFVDSDLRKDVLALFPNLKLIATRSTGYDHIDIEECRRRGIKVANVPSYGDPTVAEFTFALILNLSRKIYDAYHRVREEGSFDLEGLRGFDLKGKTIGVVGTGAIGRGVVRIAKGFGMEVLASDVKPDEEFSKEYDFEYCDLEKLLEESDIVTLHVPYLKSTHHLINRENIYKMKKGAYLINTSRGAVVETEAIVEALEKEHLGGAGLDVLEEEGAVKDELEFLVRGHPKEKDLRILLADHILVDHPRVLVTPHNAFNTKEAIERILITTLENIHKFIKGEEIKSVN